MADFCLLPRDVEKLRTAFESKELTAETLAGMSSAERHSAFADLVGEENARRVNASFEGKLLLKHQQDALTRWVDSAGKLKPEIKRDMLSKVGRLDRVLTETEQNAFLTDLAHQKLGFGVTMEEAGKISELAKNAAAARARNDFEAYMDAHVAFREYVNSVTPHKLTIPQAIAAYVRAGALSWPTTILKLTSVALSRTVTTPLTDLAALGVSKVLPALAEGAPRYGTRSGAVALQAEAAAQAAMWTDGIIDSGRMLQNKASRLDLMHGDKGTAHAWYEYSGSIHGALKEPIKRAEYARSFYRRTADALARGEDVNDVAVKLRLSTEAYVDAQRAISMQDNVISSGWNAGLKRLEQVDKETGKTNPLGTFLATALRVDMPIMKAPTNIVLEASEYIGGLLTGGSRAAWNYAHGLEGLKPIERDAIIRQIAKGSVGAAIMALYYFKSNQVDFGGFYEPGEKRKPSDVPVGAARVGAVNIPKNLLHNPMIYAAQFAASAAHVAKAKHADDAAGYASALGAAAIGLIDEVPVIGNLPKDIHALSDPNLRDQFLDKKIAGAAIPGIVQWIAKQTDPAEKRYPKGLGESLEANLPGLRQSVPTTKRKKGHR
jgi:hypothetical protein